MNHNFVTRTLGDDYMSDLLISFTSNGKLKKKLKHFTLPLLCRQNGEFNDKEKLVIFFLFLHSANDRQFLTMWF